MARLPGSTLKMTDDEWARVDDLARRAGTSRSKVMRVALARLDAEPEEIAAAVPALCDNRFGRTSARKQHEDAGGVEDRVG